MNKSIVRLMKEQMDSEVALFAASFLADFDLKISADLASKLLDHLKSALNTYSVRDLSYLGISAKI